MNVFRSCLSLLFSLAVACSSERGPDAVVDAGLDQDAPVDTGECPVGSHRTDRGDCDSTVSWSEGPALPMGVHHHATFVGAADAGTWLYVAGGARDSSNFNRGVARARVQADGSLAEWMPAPSLARGLVGLSVAHVGQTVVVTGGLTSSKTYSTATYLTEVQTDGNLAEWHAGPAIAKGCMHHFTVAVGENVYLIGGMGSEGPIGTVHRARAIAPGTIEPWQQIGVLPEPRSHHSIAVSGRYLLLTGGMTSGAVSELRARDVLRAEVLDDGLLGPWTVIGTLPNEFAVHASFVRRGWFYLIGGLKDGAPTGELIRAPISEDGNVGAWGPAPNALPFPRAHVHQVPLADDRYLYSVGGMIKEDGTSTPQVLLGRFD